MQKINLEEISDLLSRPIIWLYSGNWDGKWLYDLQSMKRLDKIYNDFTNDNDSISSSDSYSNDPIDDTKKKYDPVSFEGDEDDDSTVNYNLSIMGHEYKIDMNTMRQINLQDFKKQRSIFRFDMNPYEKLSDANKLKKLITFGAKGVSGKYFT